MTAAMSDRRRLAAAVVAGLGAALLAAAPAGHAAQASATARLKVVKALTTSVTPLNFGRLQVSPSGTAMISPSASPSRTGSRVTPLPGPGFNAAVVTLSGEPGLSYRIVIPGSVPSVPGGYAVNTFKMTSANNSSLSTGTVRIGQLSASGADTVWIGGTINLPAQSGQNTYSANIPVTITYE